MGPGFRVQGLQVHAEGPGFWGRGSGSRDQGRGCSLWSRSQILRLMVQGLAVKGVRSKRFRG
jgi:hypothetical protein